MRNLFYCGLIAFVLATAGGAVLIPVLQKLKFGQSIRGEGPAWHQNKSGTPTMGGIIFILASVASALIFTNSSDAFIILFCALLFGVVGFADDYIKVVKKRNLGLTASQKFSAQLLIAAAYSIIMTFWGGSSINASIPFSQATVNFGLWLQIPYVHP
jgi:phospho-N-acetylmuramoyl-pentapeptide-transferase